MRKSWLILTGLTVLFTAFLLLVSAPVIESHYCSTELVLPAEIAGDLPHEEQVRRALYFLDPEVKNVEIIAHPSGVPLYLAIWAQEPDWWEGVTVVGLSGREMWAADTPGVGPIIRQARWITLKGIDYPVIEVFATTHQGNGILFLLELRGMKLVTLLETGAWDHGEGVCLPLDNGEPLSSYVMRWQMSPDYTDLDGDGYFDITLTGSVEGVGPDPEDQWVYKTVFYFDPATHQFVEDPQQRAGPAFSQ